VSSRPARGNTNAGAPLKPIGDHKRTVILPLHLVESDLASNGSAYWNIQTHRQRARAPNWRSSALNASRVDLHRDVGDDNQQFDNQNMKAVSTPPRS
jgi:hypothetical protein